MVFLVAADPIKPPQAPPDPPHGPGGPKMAQMHFYQSSVDNWWQKNNFRRGENFDLFFHSECTLCVIASFSGCVSMGSDERCTLIALSSNAQSTSIPNRTEINWSWFNRLCNVAFLFAVPKSSMGHLFCWSLIIHCIGSQFFSPGNVNFQIVSPKKMVFWCVKYHRIMTILLKRR